MKRSRTAVMLLVMTVALLTLWLAHQRLLTSMAGWLDVGGVPEKADAVVLLNGSVNVRPFVAAALVKGRWAPRLIYCSVELHPQQSDKTFPTYPELYEKMLAYCGLRAEQVTVLDVAAATTFDEARGVARYLDEHPAKRLLIVTEGPHTRRSLWVFRRVLGDRPVELRMVSAPTDEFQNDNWWRCEQGFLFVVSEYLKLLFYAARYGWLVHETLGIIVLFLLARWVYRRWKGGGGSVVTAAEVKS